MINRIIASVCLSILLWVSPVMALSATAQSENAPSTPDTSEPIAPYDTKLLRFSEVLGSLHYLRALCGANEGTKWRDAMNDLLVSEQPRPARRARLVSRFNRGYRSLNQIYSSCTESALVASDRYKKEGVLLASQITSRYGR